jgi:hypothetical protein
LYAYFTSVRLANLNLPNRPYFTTNDPVLTPELLDHFFNVRTKGFAALDSRKKLLLHSIYDLPAYRKVLPEMPPQGNGIQLRQHQRYSVKCPGKLRVALHGSILTDFDVHVIEVSEYGFQAYSRAELPLNVWSSATVQLGKSDTSVVKAMAVRAQANGFDGFYGFRVGEPDHNWRNFVHALQHGCTHGDLEHPALVA